MLDFRVFKQLMGVLQMSQEDEQRDYELLALYKEQYLNLNQEERGKMEEHLAKMSKPILISLLKTIGAPDE